MLSYVALRQSIITAATQATPARQRLDDAADLAGCMEAQRTM
jgi:hypothetical protein